MTQETSLDESIKFEVICGAIFTRSSLTNMVVQKVLTVSQQDYEIVVNGGKKSLEGRENLVDLKQETDDSVLSQRN